jgi:hypothetical protein
MRAAASQVDATALYRDGHVLALKVKKEIKITSKL